MSKYFTCPNCGGDVPQKALACPECGSDEETGWSEEAKYVHLLPDREADALTPKPSRAWVRFAALLLLVGTLAIYPATLGMAWSLYVVPAIALTAGLIYLNANSPQGKEKRLYTALLERTRGDRDLADRLIELERRRTPSLSRVELIQDAIDRLERDRGR